MLHDHAATNSASMVYCTSTYAMSRITGVRTAFNSRRSRGDSCYESVATETR